MTLRLFLFLVWALALSLAALAASYFAWSPYSDEERPVAGQHYGPTHK